MDDFLEVDHIMYLFDLVDVNRNLDLATVLWIRIRNCRIHIIVPDRDRHPGHLDPDRYRFQANDKVNKLLIFSINLMRKIKHCKLAMLWLKRKKIPICVKLEVGFAQGSASFWCQSRTGSASKRCRSSTLPGKKYFQMHGNNYYVC